MKDKELLEMRYVPGSVEVKVGDIVYTTGQDGIYPAGLKLGEIVEVRSGSATISHHDLYSPNAQNQFDAGSWGFALRSPATSKFEKSVPNAVKEEKGRK